MTKATATEPTKSTNDPYEIYKLALKAVINKSTSGATLTIQDVMSVCPHLTEDELNKILRNLDDHNCAFLALPPLKLEGGFRAAKWWVNPLGGFGTYDQANRLDIAMIDLTEQPICGCKHVMATEAATYAMEHWPERLR